MLCYIVHLYHFMEFVFRRDQTMHITPGFVVRQIAGETIAVPSGPSAQCLSGLLALNGSGEFLFNLLQSEQTQDSLVQALLDTYEVDSATAGADVDEFLQILRQNGILVEDPS